MDVSVAGWAVIVVLIGVVAFILIDHYYQLRWRHHRRVIEDIKREERGNGE